MAVQVRSHVRRPPRSRAGRGRSTEFDFAAAVTEALHRAERGERTERELLREAALVKDPSGDLARLLDAFAAGEADTTIEALRAVLATGRTTTEGSTT